MSDTIKLVASDSLPDIVLSIIDEDTGLPVDLTDIVSASLYIRKVGETTIALTLSGLPDAPATGGVLRFVFAIGALNAVAAGNYEGEIELHHVSGKTRTIYKPQKFKIRAQFA